MLAALKRKLTPEGTIAELLEEALALTRKKDDLEAAGLTAAALAAEYMKSTLSTRERIEEVRKTLHEGGPHLERLRYDIARLRKQMIEGVQWRSPPRNPNYAKQHFNAESHTLLSTMRIFPQEVVAAVVLDLGDEHPALWGKIESLAERDAEVQRVRKELDEVLQQIGKLGAELGDEVAIQEWGETGLVKPTYVCSKGAVNVFPLRDSGARLLRWAEERKG
jgi:hypothetical protein